MLGSHWSDKREKHIYFGRMMHDCRWCIPLKSFKIAVSTVEKRKKWSRMNRFSGELFFHGADLRFQNYWSQKRRSDALNLKIWTKFACLFEEIRKTCITATQNIWLFRTEFIVEIIQVSLRIDDEQTIPFILRGVNIQIIMLRGKK